MKILVRVPNWLGDAVMSTPSLELLFERFAGSEFTFVGSSASIALFERDSRIKSLIVDDSKNSFLRIYGVYKLAKRVGKHDIAFTFQNSLLSALFLFWSGSLSRVGIKKEARAIFLTHSYPYQERIHQVERYYEMVKSYLGIDGKPRKLSLVGHKKSYPQKRAGLAAGAKYGEAKMWDSLKFAELALKLSQSHEVVILGGAEDVRSANVIERALVQNGIENYQNLNGKTTISELIDEIASLDIFITNDSGPMHIAAAFEIPTVAIFGPTDEKETSQWQNPNGKIVKINIPCAPCKKRRCPLDHHKCMEDISVDDVYKGVLELVSR